MTSWYGYQLTHKYDRAKDANIARRNLSKRYKETQVVVDKDGDFRVMYKHKRKKLRK